MTVRRLRPTRVAELRQAIRAAREGHDDGDGVLFTLERGYSVQGRMLARALVGIGVTVILFAGVAAFIAPSAAVSIIGFVVIPSVIAVAVTVGLSWSHDTGIEVRSDGTLRAEGWGGVRELDLRSYPRVTVAARRTGDDVSPIGG